MTHLVTSEFSCTVPSDHFGFVKAMGTELFIASAENADDLAPHMAVAVDKATSSRGDINERLKTHLGFVLHELKPMGVTAEIGKTEPLFVMGRAAVLAHIAGTQKLPKSDVVTPITMVIVVSLGITP